MNDVCKKCPYHYELTEEQKENYDGHCGCESIESTGMCYMAHDEEE